MTVRPAAGRTVRAASVRGAIYLGLWVVLLPGLSPADLLVGVLTAGGATALSLHLLPPAAGQVRLVLLLGYLPRFLWQSVVAGADVARRVLAPAIPMQPGFAACRLALPPGPARNGFTSIASLLPGALPAGGTGSELLIHCLDTARPVAAEIAAEEARLARALLPAPSHV